MCYNQIMLITSVQNERIKKWNLLHQKKHRDETGLFLIEGEHLIQEALKAKLLDVVLVVENANNTYEGIEVVEVTQQVMDKLSDNVSHVSIMGVCHKATYSLHKRSRVVLVDGVQDPGNLGTIIRTAVSFGYDQVICSPMCVDLYNEKTIRSTQGALFYLPIVYANLSDSIDELKKEGFKVIATALQDSEALEKLESSEKMAFIFGNEGQGVSLPLIEKADESVRIDMKQFESLNVAVASGIVMYRFMNK